MQIIGFAKYAAFAPLARKVLAGIAIIAAFACPAPAAAQADERWTSDDAVMAVALPQRWRRSEGPNPSMRLLILAPEPGRTFGACSGMINARNGRSQDDVNGIAQ